MKENRVENSITKGKRTGNIGRVDRFIRITIGIAIAGTGVFLGSYWGFLAVIPLGTVLIGYCPGYAVIDWSKKKS